MDYLTMDNRFNTIEEAINDLNQGKIIIVCDDETRENEGDFFTLADTITPEIVNFMTLHGRGLICVPIAAEIAVKLKLNMMSQNNTDNFLTAFTVSVDHKTNFTGISAFDRCTTIKELINPNTTSEGFRRPGHIFPLVAKEKGVLERVGHTEAMVDLAKLCGKSPAGAICEILNLDGNMARRDDLFKIARQFNLKIITIKDLVLYRKKHEKLVKLEAKTNLPTKFGDFTICGYSTLINDDQITVIVKGNPQDFDNPFIRIHSECLTGDVFHSLRCDCGEQLDMALKIIEQEGQGVIIYLKQEGRGIGLINKLKAYELQQAGYDTFDANLKLGFNPDLREYFLAAQILKDLNIKSIRIATNNPHKIQEIMEYGIEITERVAIKIPPHDHNKVYLDTKTKKFGHLI